jgi:hypothetical protein
MPAAATPVRFDGTDPRRFGGWPGMLLAHLGRSITSLGDLDIPGSYGSELCQRARQLLDSGDTRGE